MKDDSKSDDAKTLVFAALINKLDFGQCIDMIIAIIIVITDVQTNWNLCQFLFKYSAQLKLQMTWMHAMAQFQIFLYMSLNQHRAEQNRIESKMQQLFVCQFDVRQSHTATNASWTGDCFLSEFTQNMLQTTFDSSMRIFQYFLYSTCMHNIKICSLECEFYWNLLIDGNSRL